MTPKPTSQGAAELSATDRVPPLAVPTDEHWWPTAMGRPRMTGRVVFVTGGTRGIGAAISRSFATQGAVVAAGYSKGLDHAREFLAVLMRHDAQGSIHQGNVGSADDCRRTIAEVIEQHGRLDVLVNKRGHHNRRDGSQDERRGLVQGACRQPVRRILHGASSAATYDRARDRRIINISSLVGETGNIGQANYAASKSGLSGLTKTLARRASNSSAPTSSAKTRSGSR
jgi:3-oxoacyl-[acyl-carrier protein] reductase